MQADARYEEDVKQVGDMTQKGMWKSHPRGNWVHRDLSACMLELPEPVRARLGLSADGGPGCPEASGSKTGTGTSGNASAEGSGALTNGDGSGASNSENPSPPNGARPSHTAGADDVNGSNGGAGSSSGSGARTGGSNISAATAAAEKTQRDMIQDGELRMREVARGIQQLGGVSQVMNSMGSKEVQARWADPRRLHTCDPLDFGNDTLAWASKSVGGNVSARRAASDGLDELVGQRIDVFLPYFVQWVGATVEQTLDDDKDVAVVSFWCALCLLQ